MKVTSGKRSVPQQTISVLEIMLFIGVFWILGAMHASVLAYLVTIPLTGAVTVLVGGWLKYRVFSPRG